MSDAPDRLLPLNDWHVAHGARMVSFAGYSMPIQYEGIMAEHRWTRDIAGLFDVSHMGQLIVTGAEAESVSKRCFRPTLPSSKTAGSATRCSSPTMAASSTT